MTRDEITGMAKAIKQHLHRRSGKSWRVRSDTRGTAYGHIAIDIPRTGDPLYDDSLAEELGRLMGFNEPKVQITFDAWDGDYLRRAAGALVNPASCGLCGTQEYRFKAPYCARCQTRVDRPYVD